MLNVQFGKAWTTHIGVLVDVLYKSVGDAVEMGAGPSSTPILHWLCKNMNRQLVTYENSPDFYQYAKQFQSRQHKIVFIKNWDEVDTKTHRGIVFIDHAPEDRRGLDAIRFASSADYIVIHDTNIEKNYIEVWPHFKYTYTWKECRPWTSVVSNFRNLFA